MEFSVRFNEPYLISIDLPFLAKAWGHVLRLYLNHEILFMAENW